MCYTGRRSHPQRGDEPRRRPAAYADLGCPRVGTAACVVCLQKLSHNAVYITSTFPSCVPGSNHACRGWENMQMECIDVVRRFQLHYRSLLTCPSALPAQETLYLYCEPERHLRFFISHLISLHTLYRSMQPAWRPGACRQLKCASYMPSV